MGVVYRAYDPRLKRNVALKLIAPELSGDARFRERFLAETELAASLEHPNVVPIHDAGEVDGQLYIAMRYVEGGELKTLLQKEGALEPERAVAICGQIAAALDAAHARGLVHRDVKPSNVLLDENEHVYLADFGLSRRLTDPGRPESAGLSVGTPAYAAPEQIEGGDVDGRADVYSLGCLLYECLTGEPPYSARLRARRPLGAPAGAAAEAERARSRLPGRVDAVLAKAMAKNPDERTQRCGELVDAAREALGLHELVVVRDRKALLLVALGAAVVGGALARGRAAQPGRRPRQAEHETDARLPRSTRSSGSTRRRTSWLPRSAPAPARPRLRSAPVACGWKHGRSDACFGSTRKRTRSPER